MPVYEPQKSSTPWLPGRSWPLFVVLTIVVHWVIHAIAFFAHEYAHSFSAWLLGWKTNPLALDYGGLNTGNIVAQVDPIFAAHHDVQAAFIAVAGMAIGNGLTYLLSRWGYRRARKDGRVPGRSPLSGYAWPASATSSPMSRYVPSPRTQICIRWSVASIACPYCFYRLRFLWRRRGLVGVWVHGSCARGVLRCVLLPLYIVWGLRYF